MDVDCDATSRFTESIILSSGSTLSKLFMFKEHQMSLMGEATFMFLQFLKHGYSGDITKKAESLARSTLLLPFEAKTGCEAEARWPMIKAVL